MQINMTTFAGRVPHYLPGTVASLFASDWRHTSGHLNLMVGSEDESVARQVAAGNPRVHVVPWDVEATPSRRLNSTLNKIRALRYDSEDSPLLFCEDDLVFWPGWYASLQEAAAELDGEPYVLSLFCDKRLLEKAPLVPGKTWIKQYPTKTLQGAQALYFPSRDVQLGAADYLAEHLTEGCGDDLVGRYAKRAAALYSTRTILVGHIGAVSCFAPTSSVG